MPPNWTGVLFPFNNLLAEEESPEDWRGSSLLELNTISNCPSQTRFELTAKIHDEIKNKLEKITIEYLFLTKRLIIERKFISSFFESFIFVSIFKSCNCNIFQKRVDTLRLTYCFLRILIKLFSKQQIIFLEKRLHLNSTQLVHKLDFKLQEIFSLPLIKKYFKVVPYPGTITLTIVPLLREYESVIGSIKTI